MTFHEKYKNSLEFNKKFKKKKFVTNHLISTHGI